MQNSYKGIFLASTTAFLWGFLALALKAALQFIDPYTIVFFRFASAFVIVFLFMWFRHPKTISIFRKIPPLLIVAALCLGINYIGFIQGVKLASPNTTQIVIQMGPMLLALTGIIFFKEHISLLQGFGFIIAIAGFTIFYSGQMSNFSSDSDSYNLGILFVVLAAVSWTGYSVIQKILVKKHHPQQLNLIIYLIPALLYIPSADFNTLFKLELWQWGLMLFLGINTVFAYGCLTASFKYIEANKISIIVTLNPIITIFTNALLRYYEVSWFNAESLSFQAFIGALTVITGAIIAVSMKKRIKPLKFAAQSIRKSKE